MGRFFGLPVGRVNTRNCTDARGIYNSYFVTYSCKYVTTDIFPQFGATAGEEELPASATAGAGGSAGLTGPPSGEPASQGALSRSSGRDCGSRSMAGHRLPLLPFPPT